MIKGQDDTAIVIRFTNTSGKILTVTFPVFSAPDGFAPAYPSISATCPNLDGGFKTFANYVANSKIEIEKTYIRASSPEQLTQTITLIQDSIFGNKNSHNVNVVKNPMQKQNNMVVINQDIIFDKFHAIQITLLEQSFIEFHFYPKTIVMGADGLTVYTLPIF